MADLSLHETLTGRLEQFARDQVLERADRTCELVLALLKREGGLTVVDGVGRIGGRGLATVRDLLDDVAQSSGLSLALYVGERLAVASTQGLGKDGASVSLPKDVLQVALVRGETYSGAVELNERTALVVVRPIVIHGQTLAAVMCGIGAHEANSALLGLSSIESDIIALADQVQMERQRAVSDFLKIIRSIAKRIHLLALNASILSAQAGEQGRGFAVVAREIGDLAERTRQSTQELEAEFLGSSTSHDIERRTGGRGRAA
ncbi:MAG TPA: methyl-accepting chemotaxis protein [Myxococcota bacterium]